MKETKKFLAFLMVFAAFAGIGFLAKGGDLTGAFGGSDQLTIPLSEISEDARFYEYEVKGDTIRFFAVEADDGSIKTAFDACDVCYNSDKGYRQQGDYMVCNNCGNKYETSGLGTENLNPGGCWPSYLPNKVIGDSVVIKASDLAKKRFMFA